MVSEEAAKNRAVSKNSDTLLEPFTPPERASVFLNIMQMEMRAFAKLSLPPSSIE